MTDVRTVFVAGSSGTTGRRVVRDLSARGIQARPGSRTGSPPFDWTDDSTWGAVLDGADAVYLGGATEFPVAEEFVARAVAAGVQRLVLLSARAMSVAGYYDDQGILAAPVLEWERAVKASGIAWVVLRPGWFQQNFDEVEFADAVRDGVLELPFDDGEAAFIDAEDIAAVATVALVDGSLDGTTIELTGPESVGMRDAVERIARATGRPLDYRSASPEQYRAHLVADGADDASARVSLAALSPISAGREGETTGEVERILGRPASTFDDYVARVSAADGWPRSE